MIPTLEVIFSSVQAVDYNGVRTVYCSFHCLPKMAYSSAISKPMYFKFIFSRKNVQPEHIYNPIMAMGFLQCLPFSWTTQEVNIAGTPLL